MARFEAPLLEEEEEGEAAPEAAATVAAGREGGGVEALPRGERVTVISRSCADRDMLAVVVAIVAVANDAAPAATSVAAVSRLLPLRGAADDQPSQLRGPAAAAVENVEGIVAWEPLRLCLLWERWWR